MSIYDRIEFLIHHHGLTKKEFCRQLGISTGNLGDWKRGKSSPGSNKLIDISTYFDVSLDWLMTGRERYKEIDSSMSSDRVCERTEAYEFEKIGELLNNGDLTAKERDFIREYIEFTQYRKQQAQQRGK